MWRSITERQPAGVPPRGAGQSRGAWKQSGEHRRVRGDRPARRRADVGQGSPPGRQLGHRRGGAGRGSVGLERVRARGVEDDQEDVRAHAARLAFAAMLAREVEALDWYHTLELGDGVVTPGWLDTR